MTETCRKSNGKPIRFILNEDNPAMYVSVDPSHPTLMALQRAERVKLFNKFTLDDKGRLLLQVSRRSCVSTSKQISPLGVKLKTGTSIRSLNAREGRNAKKDFVSSNMALSKRVMYAIREQGDQISL
jgi:hypothetical protein